jgi:hypothetical protein
MSRSLRWFVLITLILLVAGCSRGGTGLPQVNPRDAGAEALAAYDTNKDGALDAKELDQCPALRGSLKRIDKDKDGRLSADEIVDRFTFLRQAEGGMSVAVNVTFDRRALSGATVTLVPEKFMGAAFKSLSTVTDESGAGFLKAEGADHLEASCGFYRIEVSKKNAQGQETIPAKYNAKTVLGYEISPDVEGRGSSPVIRLPLTR